MKLQELIDQLTAIADQGFGDRRVIDGNGNDVMRVTRPMAGEPTASCSDRAAVMLGCYIDHTNR